MGLRSKFCSRITFAPRGQDQSTHSTVCDTVALWALTAGAVGSQYMQRYPGLVIQGPDQPWLVSKSDSDIM
jgi:hypothetical protein